MKKSVNIRRETTAFMILEHIYNMKLLQRAEVGISMFDLRNERNMQNGLQGLIDSGLVAVSSGGRGGQYIYLTRAGHNILEESDDEYFYENRKESFHYSERYGKKGRARIVTQSAIQNICCGTGVMVYPRHKLPFSMLVEQMTGRQITDKDRNDKRYDPNINISELLEIGVYYAADEIRGILQQNGGAEQTYRSRFNGIVLTTKNMYILYNTKGSLIRWNMESESTITTALLRLFAGYSNYFRVIENEVFRPIGVIVGNRYALVPALTLGYKSGKIRNSTKSENINVKTHIEILTSRTSVFRSIYFAPLTRTGVLDLRSIYQTDAEKYNDEADKYFSQHSNIYERRSMDPLYRATHKSHKVSCVYFSVAEVKKLHRIRDAGREVWVCTTVHLANSISQSLGTLVIGMTDIESGRDLDFQRYDMNGYTISDSKDTRRETKKETKVGLTIWISGTTKARIDALTKDAGMSRSEFIQQAIESHLQQSIN